MGLWSAPLDLKSADFSVHFGNHFGKYNGKKETLKILKKKEKRELK